MCGRNSLFAAQSVLEERFAATVEGKYRRQYNIAPGETTYIITSDRPAAITEATWGFAPGWADSRLINARAETIAETAPFTDAWEHRPCLVLSSGFYEWQDRPAGAKQPYRVHRADDVAFAMGGVWQPTEEGPVATVVTTPPNETMAPLHHRMSVVLARSDEQTWLEAGPATRQELARPYDGGDLTAVEISTRVNDPANDDPGVIEPVETSQAGLDEF